MIRPYRKYHVLDYFGVHDGAGLNLRTPGYFKDVDVKHFVSPSESWYFLYVFLLYFVLLGVYSPAWWTIIGVYMTCLRDWRV